MSQFDVDAAKRRILERTPLQALIGESVQLTTRGGQSKGCCPIHGEKTPSFYIYSDHYHCFGCGAHGDAISFVRHQFGLNFIESLRFLANKYSIEVPELEQSSAERSQRHAEVQLYGVMAKAQNHFKENLAGERGQAARDYLESRGFTPDKISEFGFGLSLDEPAELISNLRGHGVSGELLKLCSLARESKSGRLYDYFQNRLMIPIWDRLGRVIAFGGRTMANDPAKYINSQNTKLFDKSVTVYGIDRAREAIRRQSAAVVCEGYMDVLQLWNHGVGEAVACLGTALTIHHLRILSSFTDTIYLVFDGDNAGRRASLRTVVHALDVPQARVKVVILPEKEDPDSFVRGQGEAAFRDLLSRAQDLLDYAVTTKIEESHDLAIPELISQEFLPWLLSIKDPMQRVFLVNRIAELTGIPRSDMSQALQEKARSGATKERPRPEPTREPVAEPAPFKPLGPLEIEVIGHVFYAKPGEIIDLAAVRRILTDQLELDDLWQAFAMEMLDALEAEEAPAERETARWSTGLDPLIIELIASLKASAGAFACDHRETLITKLVRTHRIRSLKRTVSSLKAKLLKGSSATDAAVDTVEILTAINQLNREIVGLEKGSS